MPATGNIGSTPPLPIRASASIPWRPATPLRGALPNTRETDMRGKVTMADASSRDLRHDLGLIAGLVGLGVATRILPHDPNLTSVAASALFAALALRRRWLAPLVPLA